MLQPRRHAVPSTLCISVTSVLKPRVGHRAGQAVVTTHPEFRSGVLGVLVRHPYFMEKALDQ